MEYCHLFSVDVDHSDFKFVGFDCGPGKSKMVCFDDVDRHVILVYVFCDLCTYAPMQATFL